MTSVTNPLGEETIYTYVGKLLTQVATGVVGGNSGHITTYNQHDRERRVQSDK